MKVLFAFCSPCAASFHRDIVSEKKKEQSLVTASFESFVLLEKNSGPAERFKKGVFQLCHCIV